VAIVTKDKAMARSVMAKNLSIDEYHIPAKGLMEKVA
jgi:hypothetical protein